MTERDLLELNEIFDLCRQKGYGDIIDALLDSNECYTKQGRLNKSAVSRQIGDHAIKLDERLQRLKELMTRLGV